MFATIAYIVAAVYGTHMTPYTLIATVFVDFAIAKTVSDWFRSRAIARADFVPVPVPPDQLEQDEELEDMALGADEVEDRFG